MLTSWTTTAAPLYGLEDAVPVRVGNVKVNGEEAAYLQQQIYADGEFAKQLNQTLGSKAFWQEYDQWQEDLRNGVAVAKEESAWYQRLDRITGYYVSQARRNLQYGNDPVAKKFQSTYEERAAKAGSGSAGSLTPDDQSGLRNLININK